MENIINITIDTVVTIIGVSILMIPVIVVIITL